MAVTYKGNVNLLNRPTVPNPAGGSSTLYSMSFEDNGEEVLIPRVSDDGRILSESEAIEQYRQSGQNLGKFKSPTAATVESDFLHKQQEDIGDFKSGASSSSYAALVDAIMNAKPAPKPADTGVIYNPQAMERQRFEEHTGYDPTVSDLQNLIAAWKGNKIMDAPIPGANPEVGTPGDAMVGALTGAMSKSGSASNPLADILGQTAGGGMAQQKAPSGRIRPDARYRGPLEKRIKGKVYRETDAGEAEQMLMGRDAGVDRHYATSKNLALGQGRNRGIKLESDPRQLEGKIDRSKPGSQIIENRGQGEVLANANTSKNLQDSIRRVTVDKSIKRDKLESAQTRNLIKKLAREGWSRTEQGSNIILKRPVPSGGSPRVAPGGRTPSEPSYRKSGEDMARAMRISNQGKSFAEQRYSFELPVKVTWKDGSIHTDIVKGLNQGHALQRARGNWSDASAIEGITKEQVGVLDRGRTPPKPPSPPEQRRPLRAGPEERRIKKQIVEIDRRIAESDRRLKDRGLSGREPTSARYETPVDKQVREIREAIESKPSPNRLAEMIQIANENSLKTQVKPAPNQMAIDALHEAMLKRND